MEKQAEGVRKGSNASTITGTPINARPVVVRYSMRKASITPSLRQIQQILLKEVGAIELVLTEHRGQYLFYRLLPRPPSPLVLRTRLNKRAELVQDPYQVKRGMSSDNASSGTCNTLACSGRVLADIASGPICSSSKQALALSS